MLNGRGANEADLGVCVFIVRLLKRWLCKRWRILAVLWCLYRRSFALFLRLSTAAARTVPVAAASPSTLGAAPSTASPAKRLVTILGTTMCTSAASATSSAPPLRACRDLCVFLGAS